MAQLSWMVPSIGEPQDALPEVGDQVPDIVVDDLTDAQKIDFLTSVSGVADRTGIGGISGLYMHLHG